MKAIAIDDEPVALDVIKKLADKVPFLQLKALYTDAFEALEYLQTETVDLIFLDIKMPDISGIEFFSSLAKKPMVIFTTAYTEHAVTSFELDAVDYLLKPFSLSRFIKSCNKAFELYTFRSSAEVANYLYVKTGYEQVKVLFDEVLYLEASGNYVTFVLPDKTLLSRSTFLEAMSLLPGDQFIRTHRSYVVAVDKIDRLERFQVTVGKKAIPVSEAYYSEVAEALKRLGAKRSTG